MIQKENPVKVWDSFVRLFHLLIILLVAGLWWTADNGRMDLHKDFGIAILSLLVMRIAWVSLVVVTHVLKHSFALLCKFPHI